ncbi:hypothetical protein NG798_25320 [Ancylothrix sp. C2]|uniref:hypothetical protein n=1 Tax=Ancylothrix sp. D3o TaxID=2953691 RepID=UPI0021BAD052|nr:hypothetical protein [Ancylothrix sp. D3o]MCT7953123.1 hypothetical protein [Ancylothrix sp. D3o]
MTQVRATIHPPQMCQDRHLIADLRVKWPTEYTGPSPAAPDDGLAPDECWVQNYTGLQTR